MLKPLIKNGQLHRACQICLNIQELALLEGDILTIDCEKDCPTFNNMGILGFLNNDTPDYISQVKMIDEDIIKAWGILDKPSDGGFLVSVKFQHQLFWLDTPEGKIWSSHIQHWYWRLWYKLTKDPIDLID